MNNSKIKFLVPVDFSSQSMIVLEQACNLAKVYHAGITLCYVIEEQNSLMKMFKKGEDYHTEIESMVKEKIAALAEETQEETGIEIKILIKKGKVYEKIVEAAEQESVHLLMMGTNGSSGIKKRFIGTNAIRVVKEANCPVITIKGKHHRPGCQNIVLPLDLTKETTEKVEKAIELAKLFDGAAIRVLSVINTAHMSVINNMKNQMVDVKQKIENNGLKCAAELVKIIKGEDSIPGTIIDYAHKVNGDLLMVMTQQEKDPIAFFIGSHAQSIINQSDIPVMSIIPKGKQAVDIF